MRLPITDKFLWAVYEFLETTGDVINATGIFKLRGWANLALLGEGFWRNIQKKKDRRQFAQFVNYLKKKGYIKIANLKGKKGILITPKGKQKALKVKVALKEKKKRRDGRWIMIMYDIPEKEKRERTLLRETLRMLGYQNFQKSIWVCPYDVLKETEEVIRAYSLDSYVRIFLIEEIEL